MLSVDLKSLPGRQARQVAPTALLVTAVILGLLIQPLSPRAAAAEALDVGAEADRLRHLSYAQLENEKPAEAEKTLLNLARLVPGDPLPWANLAISRLRQQSFEAAGEAIDKAVELAPASGEVLAIRGEIEQWSGSPDAALATFARAAELDPDDPELQYSLLRQSTTLGPAGDSSRRSALERLSRLRPENLVVLLGAGQLAIEDGTREEATRLFLRIGELLWQAPAIASTALSRVHQALNAGDTAAARVPAQQLSNVLKVTAMYQQGLRELVTGIQGIPLREFAHEPQRSRFGEALEVRFIGQRLSSSAAVSGALALGDLDGDRHTDIAWVHRGENGKTLEAWSAIDGFAASRARAASTAVALATIDIDNDGRLELVAPGPLGTTVWNLDDGWNEATASFGLATLPGSDVEAIDFDIEGDLDLALVGGRGLPRLLRNSLEGLLEDVSDNSLPPDTPSGHRAVAVSDLDRDGDLDLVLGGEHGLTWLDNLRQGEFVDRTAAAGLSFDQPIEDLTSADLDNDGWPDLIAAGQGLFLFHNLGGRFEPWQLGKSLATPTTFHSLLAFDADNDGRLDIAAAGPQALVVLQQSGDGFRFVTLEGAPAGATALASADLDDDGDLDLVAAGADGLYRLSNDGGNGNGWLTVSLRGLTKGNSKNNALGRGSSLEIRSGGAYQFREVQSEVTHFGLGNAANAELLRVVWTNGVPQNRFDLAAEQTIVEEQLLKGSCPFLYVWNGERIEFVTDLLWGAPIGLPVAAGIWAGADPGELVRVDGAVAQDGVYQLRVTEELWEAAYFDQVRLWVVDAPTEVEVASNLKIIPGTVQEERVLATRALRPIATAWDATGAEVTPRLQLRDEVYAGGWDRLDASPYQGYVLEPWYLSFDLGTAPAGPIRMHLDGWIFPADASLNLAVDQRSDLPPPFTRLEVETDDGWQPLVDPMGFPAGKTKTLVIDTPALPEGATRLRIATTQWLAWDRIVWSTEPADGEAAVVSRLDPSVAELRFRGFSTPLRRAPNAPHAYDYTRTTTESPWLPFAGRYTRFGDVRELLIAADDRSVVLAPGDEILLLFDASALPEPPDGSRRTVFLESQGWDKDADRNTYRGQSMFPLPFRAMSGYPYGDDESFPDTPLHRRYLEEWLTRAVGEGLPVEPSNTRP